MDAVIYSNGNQECERAKILLEKLNFQIHVYKLNQHFSERGFVEEFGEEAEYPCLLYTSPSPRDVEESRMPSSA